MARVSRHVKCSFCGKSRNQVWRLIAGPNGVYICDACVSLCNELIAEGEHGVSGQQTEGSPPTRNERAASRWRRIVRRWLLVRGGRHVPHMRVRDGVLALTGE